MKKKTFTYWSSQSFRTLGHWQSGVGKKFYIPYARFNFIRMGEGVFPLPIDLKMPDSQNYNEYFYNTIDYNNMTKVWHKKYKNENYDYTIYGGICRVKEDVKLEPVARQYANPLDLPITFTKGVDGQGNVVSEDISQTPNYYTDVAVPVINQNLLFYAWEKENNSVLPQWAKTQEEQMIDYSFSTGTYDPHDIQTNDSNNIVEFRTNTALTTVLVNSSNDFNPLNKIEIEHEGVSGVVGSLANTWGRVSGFLPASPASFPASPRDWKSFENIYDLEGITPYALTGWKATGTQYTFLTPTTYEVPRAYYGDQTSHSDVLFSSGYSIGTPDTGELFNKRFFKCGSSIFNDGYFQNFAVKRYIENGELVGCIYIGMLTPIKKLVVENHLIAQKI